MYKRLLLSAIACCAMLIAPQMATPAEAALQRYCRVGGKIVNGKFVGGRLQPGRCPGTQNGKRVRVVCVHHRTDSVRNEGHCQSPSH